LQQIFIATKTHFLKKMATYRQNNLYGYLEETEGDPEVEAVKETPKKQEAAKTTIKKQDPTPQKPADKNQGTQNKKPADNQPNKAAKPADKPAPRANNAPPNKAPTNNAKPQAAPADSGVDLDLTEKPTSTQKQRTYEAVKKDRKSRNGYDNTTVKKGGEGRYNWGGPGGQGGQGEEYRQRKPRRADNSFEDTTKEGEENPAVAKEGEAAPAEGADTTKPDVAKEPEKKSFTEYMEEQKNKAKLDLKLPEIRQAGEGEEGKWKDTIQLGKKKDDVYMQAAEVEPKKATATTTATAQVEKDTKNKKGQVLELDLPRLRKQPRENKRENYKDGNYKDGNFKDGNFKDGGNFKGGDGSFKNSNFKDNNSKDAPKKGSFKKSEGATLTLDDFPRLSNTA